MRSSVRASFRRVLRLGLLAKIVVGTTVAFAGAGAVAATSALPDSSDGTVAVAPADDAQAAADVVLAGHEGLAHEGDADDATDPGEDEQEPAGSEAQAPDAQAARQEETPAVVSVEEDDDQDDDTGADAAVDAATQADTATGTPTQDTVDEPTQDTADEPTQDTADEPTQDTADEPAQETADDEGQDTADDEDEPEGEDD